MTLNKKRFIAFAIDYLIIEGIEGTALILAMLIQTETALNIAMIFAAVVEVAYLLRDVIGGQSIGKRIMRIKVVDKNGEKASVSRLVLRNITAYIWPVEALLMLLKKERIGDRLAKTRVIEIE